MTPLITLTTDFGAGSPYVAAMKGAILQVNPAVQLLDLSHRLPPQDLRACSFFLRTAIPYFPAGPLHVIVVDPGVGTDRSLLYIEAGPHRLLAPDNGCWTELASTVQGSLKLITLAERRFWRAAVSATFHGRDILAPVAGHLSLGVKPEQLGPPAKQWVELKLPEHRSNDSLIEGEILFIDEFGNLLTNIPADVYQNCRSRIKEVLVGGEAVGIQALTYGEAPSGELIILVSSSGMMEIAQVQGSAARRLGAGVGMPIHIYL
jgi:S-adenosylmethionine hydrolase